MNKQQKEAQQVFLDNEKKVLKKLEENYQDALQEINNKINLLLARDDANMQNVIYQVEYQKALKKQVQGILDQLHANSFETVSEYLTKSYEDGFIGTMYDLQGQGVPLVIPIDQKQVAIAIQHETKLSKGLYAALGKDTSRLSKQIAGEISRGISNAATYDEMARNIASFSNIPRNNAARIARTEAHRIQNKATADAQWKAKEKGADVVKQWDSFLDGKTRPHHRELDGQIRELDEPFEVNGMEVMYPGNFGNPAEDCNCRCCLLQRARWALGNDFTKWDQEEGLIQIEADNYNAFKKKYQKESERVRSNAQKIKSLENVSKSSKIEITKRKQLDTGYKGKIPDDKLEEYNQKALKQIKLDTGYSDEKATELHKALLDYFGGDYESILTDETKKAQIIKNGIERMPSYDGTVYRGMVFSNEDVKQFSNLSVGDTLPTKGIISSWSSEYKTSISFGGIKDYERSSVILECENNITGSGVQHISKFGDREAEVLSSAKYEVVEVTTINKYDYLAQHKDLLYFEDDLEEESKTLRENIVCMIKVKEKN